MKLNVTVFQKIPKPLGIGAIQRNKDILPFDTTTLSISGVLLKDSLFNVVVF